MKTALGKQKRERCKECGQAIRKRVPFKAKKPRRVSVNRDPGYRKSLREEPCALWMAGKTDECDFGPRNTTEAAHTQNNGMSSKGADSSCVPLCRKHHTEYDKDRKGFEKKYGMDLRAIAAEHYQRYLAEKGQKNGANQAI